MLVENAVEVVIVRPRIPLLNLQKKEFKKIQIYYSSIYSQLSHIGSVGDPDP
jgi:hypothetical protein